MPPGFLCPATTALQPRPDIGKPCFHNFADMPPLYYKPPSFPFPRFPSTPPPPPPPSPPLLPPSHHLPCRTPSSAFWSSSSWLLSARWPPGCPCLPASLVMPRVSVIPAWVLP